MDNENEYADLINLHNYFDYDARFTEAEWEEELASMLCEFGKEGA